MAAAQPLDHDLLTPPEVLDYLRITARTLYRLIGAGQLPALRVGHQWRVRRTDLDEWLQRSTVGVGVPDPALGTHGGDGTDTTARASRKDRETPWETGT